mgnify:CR=1 FL=1
MRIMAISAAANTGTSNELLTAKPRQEPTSTGETAAEKNFGLEAIATRSTLDFTTCEFIGTILTQSK